MKNLLRFNPIRIPILVCLMLATVQSIGQSNWSSLMPRPLGFLVYDASFVDANNGWAVGESGCFAKTTDGGNTWSYRSLPLFTGNGLTNFRPTLYQVQFINTNVGYAVGSNAALLKTTDGGNTWTYINGPLGPLSSSGKAIYNLFFFDVNNGWIVGDAPNTSSAFVYKTTDGGMTWAAATNVPVINTPFFGIDFSDPNTGYICGQSGKVIRTTDGGNNWTDISLTTTNYTVIGGTATLPRTQTYRCVLALDANTAVISSQNNGCVLRTTNGGSSWYASGNQNVGIPQVATWQMAKSGPNRDTVIIAGGSARFIKSIDRGLTWTAQQSYAGSTNSYNYYYAPVAVPGVAGKYIMMGASGMINITNDGGNSWTNPYFSLGTYDGTGSSDAKNLFGVSFANVNSGMVVGAHGTLATTSNGGAIWTDKSIPSMSQVTGNGDYIYAVKCFSTSLSYIATASFGQILKSTDFGNSWTTQLNLNGSDGFTGMDFIDNNTGWVCSFTGKVYRTTDGSTWTQVPVFNSTQLNGIKFIDANTGWVVGNSGKIFKTTNGGTSWAPQTSGITNALYSVQFLDANNGFACGASGRVLVTSDGGTTWVQRNITSIVTQLNKILFLDTQRGMAFAGGGIYYSTADGGISWNPLYAPTSDVLQDATIPTGANYIVTAGGSLFGVHGDILALDNSQCNVTITSQPSGISVCPGTVAGFNVGITGSIFATYQWQVSTNSGGIFNNIGGATSSSYSFTTNGTESGYQYRCIVTGACGSPITSSAATLRFNTTPAIIQQPASLTACQGSPASFSVSASGTGLTYQWQISTNGGTSFSNIATGAVYAGATTSTMTILSTTAAQNNNQFRCVVSGLCTPAVNSAAATLTIAIMITSQPVGVTQCAGGTATYSVTATFNVGGAAYQWQVSTDGGNTFTNIQNGGVYGGATTSTLTITGTTGAMNNNQYRCVVSGGSCNLNSNTAILVVNTSPSITAQPSANTAICAGLNTSISVTANGTAPTYQWQLSTDGGATFNNLTNTGVYTGATSATLNITGTLVTMNNYQYKCVVSGTCTPSVTSNVSVLVVSTSAAITAQPVNKTVCENSVATFSVTASGTITGYQWQVSTNGGTSYTNIPSANNAAYTSIAIYSMNGNIYRCVISTVCSGNIISGNATLTVNQNPTITIAANPVVNLYPGLQSVISITNITPVAGSTYSWMKNGTAITGATNSSITVGVDDIGSYMVAVIDVNGCSGVSNTIAIGQADAGKLFIYPNPTSGKFQVRLYSTPGNTNPRSLAIFNADGARVFTQAYPVNGSYQQMNVDLSNAGKGIYEVVVIDNNGQKLAVGKVMIY